MSNETGQEAPVRAAAADPELLVSLERPVTPVLPAGVATALFLLGTCHHRRLELTDLEVLVDGVRHPVTAFDMPRRDTPGGFWATVPVRATPPAPLTIALVAHLETGAELIAPLARISIAEHPSPPAAETRPEQPDDGLIAVCMATFEPDIRLFRAQVESLRAQLDRRWICVISDDCSAPETFEQLVAVVGDDPRFSISRATQRLGFYRNFERALMLAPGDAELIALCDQDDRWHPDKLGTLRGALADAVLVYSDMRLVDAGGRVLRETFWMGRANNYTNLASMLVANTVTGAASLFRRELLDLALPFPDSPGFQFHDHWLGVLALSAGEVAYLERPLYDYVQHAGAVFGDVSQGVRRARARPCGLRELPLRARAAYFYGYLAREVQARTLLLRCADRLTPAKRRVLERFVAAERSPSALAWLAARPARSLAGRTETLATELQLVQGLLWRRLVPVCPSTVLPVPRMCDTSFPPLESFEQRRLREWRANV